VNPIPSSPTPTPTPPPPATSAWTVQASGIEPLPPQSYFAGFVGVEDFSNADKGITDKWKWTWRVESGVHKGKFATALTDRRLTPNTHAGRLIAGMAGRQLQPGEDVAALVKSFVGRVWCVTIAPGPKGGRPSVQNVSPPPEM